jgi:hypothetical protein
MSAGEVALSRVSGQGAARRTDRIGAVALDDPDLGQGLRALAEEARRSGLPIVAVLPEGEFQSGAVTLRGRLPILRMFEARGAMAAALAEEARGVAVALGATARDGRTAVAAVRRATLEDARAFLSLHGFAPVAVTAPAALPGFAAPPRIALGAPWDRLRPLLVMLRAKAPWLQRRPGPLIAAGGIAGLAAATAVVLALGPGEPQVAEDAVGIAEVGSVATGLAEPEEAARTEEILMAAPPPPRQPAAETVADELPSTVAEPAGGFGPEAAARVTISTRGRAPELVARAAAGEAPVRLANVTLSTPPMRRPGAPAPVASDAMIVDAVAAALSTVAPAGDPADSTRPLRRPGTAAPAASLAATPLPEAIVVATVAPAAGTPPAAAGLRPLARPRAAGAAPAPAEPASAPVAPVEVAALQQGISASDAGLVLAARPVPRRVAVPSRPTAAPAPVAVAAPVRTLAPAPQPVALVQPAPVQTTRAQPAPQQTARVETPPAIAAAATTQTGLSRNQVSLIGVFGTANRRHALVRMPNGSIQRVQAGDQVQGAQVAAVTGDAVRLRNGGRETILRMP